MPSPKKTLQAAGFAAATVVLGYFTGQGLINHFTERPQVIEHLFESQDKLKTFQKAYLETDDPGLRNEIVLAVQDVAPAYALARRRINEIDDDEGGILLLGIWATALASLATVASLPIKRLRTA